MIDDDELLQRPRQTPATAMERGHDPIGEWYDSKRQARDEAWRRWRDALADPATPYLTLVKLKQQAEDAGDCGD
jgi:hypothetical protein